MRVRNKLPVLILSIFLISLLSQLALADPNGPPYGCFEYTMTSSLNVLGPKNGAFTGKLDTGCQDFEDVYPGVIYFFDCSLSDSSAAGLIKCFDPGFCPGGIIDDSEWDYCRCLDGSVYKKSDGGVCSNPAGGVYALEECNDDLFAQIAYAADHMYELDSAEIVDCEYDSCIEVTNNGGTYITLELKDSATTEFVLYGMIDTSNLNSGKGKVFIEQYNENSKITSGTRLIGEAQKGFSWMPYGKTFELDPNTVRINITFETESSSSGKTLFSFPHLGPKEDDDGHDSCIETRCNDGFNNDFDNDDSFDSLKDMLDEDCYSMTEGKAKILEWDTLARDIFLQHIDDWFDESAKNGADGACGDDNYYSCDQRNGGVNSCEDISSPELCLFYNCDLSGGEVTCEGNVQCNLIKDEESCIPPCNWDGDSCETTNDGSAANCADYQADGDLNYCIRNGCTMTYEGEVPDSGYCDGTFETQSTCDYEPWNGGYTNCQTEYCSDKHNNKEDCNSDPGCGPWITENNNNWECYSNEYLGEDDPRFSCQKNSEEECIQESNYCVTNYYSGLRDLGFIDPTGQYLCADNSPTYTDASGKKDQSLSEPGKNFVWRDATQTAAGGQYTIHQIENTHFISNNNEWFFCAADENPTKFEGNNIPPENILDEFGHFESEFDPGEEACTNPVSYIMDQTGKTDLNVINCFEDSKGDCQTKYGQEYSSQEMAFCFNNDDPTVVLSYFRIETPGENDIDACLDYCHYKSSNSNDLVNIRKYLQDVGENACENLPPGYTSTCDGVGEPGGGGIITTEDPCYMNNNCPDETYSSLRCDEIENTKTCDDKTNFYCADGQFVDAEDTSACCLGVNAYCEEYEGDATCADLGGDIKDPDKGNGVCLGKLVGDDCCVDSVWTYNTNSQFFKSDAESFMCYQSGNSNYIQECCDPVDNICHNENNPLNNYRDIISTYSYKGVNLHTIVYFDNVVMSALSNPDADSRAILSIKNFDKWVLTKPDFVKTDWSGFKGIGFNVRSLVKDSPTQLIIYDSAGGSHPYNFWDYVQTNKNFDRANKMYFPLSEATEVDITKIDKIEFVLAQSQNPVYIDNIYLVPDDSLTVGTDKKNSDTRYCSGLWKTWVEDLDGPLSSNNKGFVGQDISQLGLKDIQKYKDACDWSLYSSWTGSLCCGDDADRVNGGEYFLDMGGLCWDGVPVLPGKTLGTASGFTDEPLGAKMLFDAGKVYLCDVADDDPIFDQKIIYTPGTEEAGFVLTSSNTVDYELFGVKGNYICYPEVGWKIKTGTNRVRLLGTELGKIGDDAGDYTLFCSDDLEAINVNKDILFSAACALRTGSNADFNKDGTDVILGFVVADVDKPFNSEDGDDVESYFFKFEPLIPVAEETDNNGDVTTKGVDVEIDCKNAVDNPDDSEFFLECDVVNDNDKATDYRVYYNKPFNLVLLSSKKIDSASVTHLSFFSNFWDSFTGFFENLFSAESSYEIPISFDKSDLSNFYISKQGDLRLITGSMYDEGANNNPKVTARVDYKNLANRVKFLADAIEKDEELKQETRVDYGITAQNTQTIRVYSEDDDFTWKKFSSILRLRDVDADPLPLSPPVWGDAVAVYPEECDIDPGAPNHIYLPGDYRITSGDCERYDPRYTDGELACIEPGYDDGNGGGLDVSRCVSGPLS